LVGGSGYLTRLLKSRHGTRILDNIGNIVPCLLIDPNPVTSPRKPIHGPRDCALLSFRVARDTLRITELLDAMPNGVA